MLTYARLVLVGLTLVSVASRAATQGLAGPQLQIAPEQLYAATTDGGQLGATVKIHGGPPWTVKTIASTDGGRLLRKFGKQLFVVNRDTGEIWRVPVNGAQPQVYAFGATSEVQDIHVPLNSIQAAPLAFVTRRNNPFLHRLNLTTGAGVELLDLSPVGGGAPIALGTMERDGSRLFVQVRVFDTQESAAEPEDSGVLAVVDLLSNQLVDVEPLTPGIQGVALQGAPPRFKMQIVKGSRKLFVSTTESFYDHRGGIEIVDLDGLTSIGYAITEAAGGGDMGGFVMTTAEDGYYVFHTDLLPSTHLMHFTIAGGPDPTSEILVLLHDEVDALAYDPAYRRVFLPSGFSSNTPGIYVVNALTQQVVGAPIDTGLRPHDVLVGP